VPGCDEEVNHGDFYKDFGGIRRNFIVLGQAARLAQPGEDALDDPALGQDREVGSWGVLADGHSPLKHGLCPTDQCAV